MADIPQASKDEEFAAKLEKFGDRFPSSDDYEGITDYIAAINEETTDVDIKEMRDSVVADLEELKENWEQVRDQIDDLLKFAKETTFPEKDEDDEEKDSD